MIGLYDIINNINDRNVDDTLDFLMSLPYTSWFLTEQERVSVFWFGDQKFSMDLLQLDCLTPQLKQRITELLPKYNELCHVCFKFGLYSAKDIPYLLKCFMNSRREGADDSKVLSKVLKDIIHQHFIVDEKVLAEIIDLANPVYVDDLFEQNYSFTDYQFKVIKMLILRKKFILPDSHEFMKSLLRSISKS